MFRWPTRSSYLYPVENLGDEIKLGIWQLESVPFNLKSLESSIHYTWTQFPHTSYQWRSVGAEEEAMAPGGI
ncbi:hypothetical protein TNCV_130621 [Trichonephila clavipes]|nr:hypothetical protein TNCV_130621 [Trichonephila clavipes]